MPRILVIDDPALLSKLDGTFIRRAGFALTPFRNGEEVLRLAREQRPDLVILDIEMSPPDGLETLRRLRAEPALADAPILMLGAARHREAAMEAGVDGYLARPITQALLLAQIRAIVSLPERTNHRLPVGFRVTCSSGEDSFVAFAKDISSTGLFLKAARPPDVGTRITLSFRLPGARGEEIESEAEVVRRVGPGGDNHSAGGAGLRFVSLPAGTRIAIGRFIRESEGA